MLPSAITELQWLLYGAAADESPWRPFQKSEYRVGCEFCPKPGWHNLRQRAVLRAFFFLSPKEQADPSVCEDRSDIGRYFLLALGLELCFSIQERLVANSMRFFLLLATVACLFGPPIWLHYQPESYTPAFATLLNVLLLITGGWTTYLTTMNREKEASNSRWIPQARSACRSTLTVWHGVMAFRYELSEMCRAAADELPELNTQKMSGVQRP